jgi:hypothetical protein
VYQAVGRMQELVNSLDGCQDDHRPLINELFIAPLQVGAFGVTSRYCHEKNCISIFRTMYIAQQLGTNRVNIF